MTVSRRNFLQGAAPLALGPLWAGCDAHDDPGESDVFRHGVASGDPLADAIVLWTRVTPPAERRARVAVHYWVARDEALVDLVSEGVLETGPERDYTLKIDVGGLEPGRIHYYQFEAFGQRSPIGRTKTLPVGEVARLAIAVVSCANYPYGFFNAYRNVAARELDFVLHLGDYLYEYAEGVYGTGAPLGREPAPAHESVTLDDYRRRHAQYKADPDLRALHREHAVIAIWDDHEVANDAYRDGAQNHQPELEGDYAARKAAALQAYREWMPVRDPDPDQPLRVYRSFELGDLADLVLLDTRHLARDAQVSDACDFAAAADPERRLLGAEQEAWLYERLEASAARGARFRLIGQQVMVGQLLNVLLDPPCLFSTDQWDGYAATRARLFGFLGASAIDGVVVLTGDIHSSWAIDLSHDPFDPAFYDRDSGSGSLAVELVTPAVTSPGIDDPAQALELAQVLGATHPHVKFVELNRRGYLLLDVSPERVRADWYHVHTLTEPSIAETHVATATLLAGERRLSEVEIFASAPRTDDETLVAPPRALGG